jgi:starch synthase (maltosyl-transferring)
VVIEDIRPRTPDGGYPAKAVVGEAVPVRAAIYRDGHDVLAARVLLYRDGHAQPEVAVALHPAGNDEWATTVVPGRLGRHQLVVQAWTDRWGSWAEKVRLKLAAGLPVDVEMAEGIVILEHSEPAPDGQLPEEVRLALDTLRDSELDPEERLADALSERVGATCSGPYGATDLTVAAPRPLWVDRERALVGAWYELFPRSLGGFKGVAERVPALAEMGFDVLYLPPVHPIGTTGRKGRGGELLAQADDPGSPWAIGSAEGGHTAFDAELGTSEDFAHLVGTVRAHGMELALDYALQCSPDHPWVRKHPEWFHHRPDGSIAYAENPPKRYQDIYPINFWPDSDEDRISLWRACKEILEFWIDRGVTVFRVDNPHTKPIAFWEWLIPSVQLKHPETIFLAEAFTAPRMMAKLAEVGFTQSYTYFAWRTRRDGPEGLVSYLEELAHGPLADYMRPNFWPNTPDILSGPLRDGPPAAFALRYLLAATMAPSYGVYSGYELYENEPASPANEEYRNSEKYERKLRDFDRPGTLAPLMTVVNAVRRRHPALQRLRSIRFHRCDNPEVVAFSKSSDDGSDVVLVVVTLDPYASREATVGLDLEALGLPSDRPYEVLDELAGERHVWQGPDVYVRLDPWARVAHVFDLHPARQPVAGGDAPGP